MPTYIRFSEDHSVVVLESFDEIEQRIREAEAARIPLFEVTRADGPKLLVNASQRSEPSRRGRRRMASERADAPAALRWDPRIVAGSDYGNPDPEWPRIDWRRHLRRVELPGAEVNYVEIGEGEPILFVHGISGCWQNWLENLPHFGARPPGDRARPARLRRQPDAVAGRSTCPPTGGCSTTSARSSGSRGRRSSATRWAASSRSRR